MTRLTKKYPSGAWGIDGSIDEAVLKLAAYEDSGCTPEELRNVRWILAEERKPTSSDNPVLIYKANNDRNNNIGTAWYSPYHGWIPTNGTKIFEITHWMPLPKPPKEGGK